jgi:antirestriction protein ArdC
MRIELLRDLNESVLKALNDKRVPWHSAYGFPRNIRSQRRYNGYNGLLLMTAADNAGFKNRFWGTKNEWLDLGGTLPASAKPTEIAMYRYSWHGIGGALVRREVYNLDQVVGGFKASRAPLPPVNCRDAEQVIKKTRADIRYPDERIAEYVYPERAVGGRGDFINMVRMEHFVRGEAGINAYYHCIFHELTGHWTEPGARVGWWGDEPDAELRSEIASDFMLTELLIPSFPFHTRQHHQNHVDVWTDRIRKDPTILYTVAESAEKAVDFVLAYSDKNEKRHNIKENE